MLKQKKLENKFMMVLRIYGVARASGTDGIAVVRGVRLGENQVWHAKPIWMSL